MNCSCKLYLRILFLIKKKNSEFKSCEHTHFDHLLRSATLLHFITIEYITSNKGGRKLAFENDIYIKQKVVSNGAVWGDIMGGFFPGGFCPGEFCPRTIQISEVSFAFSATDLKHVLLICFDIFSSMFLILNNI